MIWQDYTIATASVAFSIGLIPAVRKVEKPPIETSLVTSLGMTALCVCYATLSLWFSLAVGVITTTLWYVLFFQKFRMRRR